MANQLLASGRIRECGKAELLKLELLALEGRVGTIVQLAEWYPSGNGYQGFYAYTKTRRYEVSVPLRGDCCYASVDKSLTLEEKRGNANGLWAPGSGSLIADVVLGSQIPNHITVLVDRAQFTPEPRAQ